MEEQTHQADVRDLARFGYTQELRRALGVYSSFAVAFSYISPSTGIFTLYFLGLAIAGPAFFWSWPIVVIGQLIVALNFAEVSAHFPVAGSVYQWTKYLANRHYAWFTGWVYLFAGVLTVTSVVTTFPLAFIPFLNGLGLNIPNTLDSQRIVALIVLLSTTLLSIFGVRLVALINNSGVVFEILGMVVFALILLLVYHHQSLNVLINGHPLSATGNNNPIGTFLAAMFMSLFVIYGFDTASTLAEETKNPRREAPRAVVGAVIGAAIIGTIFLVATVIAIPGDVDKYVAATAAGKAAPPVDIISGNFPGWASNIYLLVVSAAIYVCCLAIQTSTIRLAFGMARDGKLPLGRLYNRVSSSLHTPIGTCIVIGVLAAIPMLYYTGAGLIAISATGMIYISYLLGNLAILYARSKGWPKEGVPFKLGSWGLIINVAALTWGGAMIINFLWPRDVSTCSLCNPPLSALPNVNVGFLGNIPIFEATLGVILVVGAVYYLLVQRQSRATPGIAPAEAHA